MAIENATVEGEAVDVWSGLQDPAIDAAMQELGALVAQMEGGTLTAGQVLNAFERGTDLAMHSMGLDGAVGLVLDGQNAQAHAAVSQLAEHISDALQQAVPSEAEV